MVDFHNLAYVITVAGGAALGAVVATLTIFFLIFKKKSPGRRTTSWILVVILLLALEVNIIVGIFIFYESEANLLVSPRIDDRFLIIVLFGLIFGLIMAVATFVLAKFKVLSTSYEEESRGKSLFQIDRHIQD